MDYGLLADAAECGGGGRQAAAGSGSGQIERIEAAFCLPAISCFLPAFILTPVLPNCTVQSRNVILEQFIQSQVRALDLGSCSPPSIRGRILVLRQLCIQSEVSLHGDA
jgi:hypothetical protein